MNESILMLLVPVILIGGAIALVFLIKKSLRQIRPNAISPPSGAIQRGRGRWVVQNEDGSEVGIELQGGKIPSITLVMDFPHDGYIELVKENGFDRFFTRIGFSKEFETGHQEFDRTMLMTYFGASPLAERLKSSPEARMTVGNLFRSGCRQIIHENGTIRGKFRPSSFPTGPNWASSLIAELRQLIAFAPRSFSMRSANVAAKSWNLKKKVFLGLGFGALLLGLIGLFLPPSSGREISSLDPFLYSLYYSLPICTALAIVAAFQLRGVGRSHRTWLLGTAILFLGGIVLSFVSVIFINREYDRGESRVVLSMVTEKYSQKGRRSSRSYYLRLDNSGKGGPKQIKVNSSLFDSAIPYSSRLEMHIKPGYLSFPWIESYQLR